VFVSEERMARRAKRKEARRAVHVGDSHCGRGVFARRRFAAGQTIAEVVGEIFTDPDYGSNYCIDLGGGGVLEPAAPFRFLNHSCRPNCELTGRSYWNEEAAALCHNTWLVALADVAAGEELTIDYAWPAATAIPCRCGSPECRGWIVAVEQVDEVGGAAAPESLGS
jgi:SET domain-containing protein